MMYQMRYNVFWKTFDVLLWIRWIKDVKILDYDKSHIICAFLIINRHTNDTKCTFMHQCALMSRCFCLRNWLHDNIDVFNTDIDAVFLAFSSVCVIKIFPELNTDFKCPHPRLEFCHKSKQIFTTQRRWRQFLYDNCSTSRSHTVDRKTENYKKLFIVKFLLNLRKRSSLEMVHFFLRSVYFVFLI